MNRLLRLQEDRQTAKEEGSKEEGRQDGDDVRYVKNEYVLFLSVCPLAPEEDSICGKRWCIIVSLCFMVRTFPDICSFFSASPAGVRSVLRHILKLCLYP